MIIKENISSKIILMRHGESKHNILKKNMSKKNTNYKKT